MNFKILVKKLKRWSLSNILNLDILKMILGLGSPTKCHTFSKVLGIRWPSNAGGGAGDPDTVILTTRLLVDTQLMGGMCVCWCGGPLSNGQPMKHPNWIIAVRSSVSTVRLRHHITLFQLLAIIPILSFTGRLFENLPSNNLFSYTY